MSGANGIYFDHPWEQYARNPRLNFSLLKEMARSPAHFRHRLTAKREDTEAMKLGRAVHLAAFEPDRFRERVVRWDGGARRGKDWTDFQELSAGLEILTEEEHAACLAMTDAVRGHDTAGPLVSKGHAEMSVLWTHKQAGAGAVPGYSFECKGRVDFATTALADLKTTRDASPEEFGRQAFKLNMHVQAAYYSDGYFAVTGQRLPYYLIAVEKAAPHVVAVYQVDEMHLELGRVAYRSWLDKLALCKRENHWPAYFDGAQSVAFPRWAYPEEDALGLDFTAAEQGAGQ